MMRPRFVRLARAGHSFAPKEQYSKDIAQNIRPPIEQPNGHLGQQSSSTRSAFAVIQAPKHMQPKAVAGR
jgi:hypothetical protein